MFVTCLILLLTSPIIFLAIKGIFVIVMEGPLSDVRALTIEVPDSDSASDSDISVGISGIGSTAPAFYAAFGQFYLDYDEVKPWDVDLGEFMNDVEEDAEGIATLWAKGEFDLAAEATADDIDEDR